MHKTVLLDAAVEALVHDSTGIYIDGTFGRGGHSRAILARLGGSGRLLGIDKDPAAIAAGEQLAAEDTRFQIARGSFADAPALARQYLGAQQVDGVLLDLGVSSPQLDEADRGFSFLRDGPLDMRMDPASGISAADWLAAAKESEMADVFKRYGEERFARRIAGAIVAARAKAPITRTVQFAELVKEAHPAWDHKKHPATKVFQAVRIHINRELADLESLLASAKELLAVKGRLVVISFHSLEDRLVKQFMRNAARGVQLPRHVPISAAQQQGDFRLCGKALRPGAAEVDANPRARSAVLRVAERLG